METYEEKEINKVLDDTAKFGLKIQITSDNKKTNWMNIDKRFIHLLKNAWVQNLTKEQFILNSNEDEFFCLIGEAIDRIRQDNLFYISQEDNKFMILDKNLFKVCKDIKKDVKNSNYL